MCVCVRIKHIHDGRSCWQIWYMYGMRRRYVSAGSGLSVDYCQTAAAAAAEG